MSQGQSQRITRSRRGENDEPDLLSDMNGKLTMISEKLSTLNSLLADIFHQNKVFHDDIRKTMLRPVTTSMANETTEESGAYVNIFNTVTKLHDAISNITNVTQPQEEMREFVTIQLEREARSIKEQMEDIWNNTLNQRKMEYYKATWENKIADLYTEWIKADSPIIPNKFKSRPVTKETDGERRIKISLSIEKMKSDVEIRRLRAKRHTENFTDLDTKMSEEINKLAAGELKKILINMWEKDCKREERKSIHIMEQKSKGYEEKVRDSQQNNQQDSRENRNTDLEQDWHHVPNSSRNRPRPMANYRIQSRPVREPHNTMQRNVGLPTYNTSRFEPLQTRYMYIPSEKQHQSQGYELDNEEFPLFLPYAGGCGRVQVGSPSL